MGAYIYYRTADVKDANKAWEVLQNIEENQLFLDKGWGVGITNDEDIEWAKKERPVMVEYFTKELGKGDYKVSGWDTEEELGITFDEFLERLTIIFEKLNKVINMKYLYGNCAFSGSYFSKSQIDRITNEGKLFSNR